MGWVAAPVDPLTYFDEEAGQHRTIEFPPGMVRGMVPVGTLPPGFRRLDPNEFPPLKNSPENSVPIGPVPFGTIIASWSSETKAAKPTQRGHTSKANPLIAHLRFDDMAKITPEQMIGYKDHLLTSDPDHATIGNHLSALHTLFRYAKRNRKITTDPMAELVFKAKSDGRQADAVFRQ